MAWRTGMPAEFVDIANLRIAYRRAGSGTPVMLLHSGLSDSREWRHQIAGLSDNHRVCAWDAPGCGASSDPDEAFRLPEYADTLAALMQALDMAPAAIVGLSFGSGLALQLYDRHPELVSSIVLASPYAGWAGSLPADEVRRRLARAELESTMPANDLVAGWIADLLTEGAPAELAKELRQIIASFHPAGYRAMARSFAEADLRSVLRRIQVPVLVVLAEQDRRMPIDVGRALAQTAPGARVVELLGVGHMSNMEAPAAFNEAVRRFLDSTRV